MLMRIGLANLELAVESIVWSRQRPGRIASSSPLRIARQIVTRSQPATVAAATIESVEPSSQEHLSCILYSLL